MKTDEEIYEAFQKINIPHGMNFIEGINEEYIAFHTGFRQAESEQSSEIEALKAENAELKKEIEQHKNITKAFTEFIENIGKDMQKLFEKAI